MMDERQKHTARRTRKRFKEVTLRLATRTYARCLQNASRHNSTTMTTNVQRHTEARCVTMVLPIETRHYVPFYCFDIDVAVNNPEVFSVAMEMQY